MTDLDRRVFVMRLNAGALGEYRRLHRGVWPELVEEIRQSGVVRMWIYEDDPLLVVVSEIKYPDAWERLRGSDVHRRWSKLMEPLLEFHNGEIHANELTEVYRFG